MFFEEGWVSLSEVTADVFRTLQAVQTEGKLGIPQTSLTPVLALSVWDICDAATKVGVTGPDGTVIPASKDLVAWADPMNLSNEHINLMVGSVGSTTLLDESGALPSREELAERYGPFLNLPVVIPINNFQSSMTFLSEEVQNEEAKDELVLKSAQIILQMVKSGTLVTREIARVKLGASLSRRKFKRAWALAAQHVPELSSPNRWQGL